MKIKTTIISMFQLSTTVYIKSLLLPQTAIHMTVKQPNRAITVPSANIEPNEKKLTLLDFSILL